MRGCVDGSAKYVPKGRRAMEELPEVRMGGKM